MRSTPPPLSHTRAAPAPTTRAAVLAATMLAAFAALLLSAGAAQARDLPGTPSVDTQASAPKAWGALTLVPDLSLEAPGERPETESDAVAQTRRRRRTYRRRYYRYGRYRPGPRYVHQHVVVTDPDPGPRIVTDPPLRKRRRQGMSLALRGTQLAYATQVHFDREAAEGDLLGGVGLALRADLDKHWGTELSVDMAVGRGELYDVAAVPVMVSIMARLFPESRLDLYGLAGVGVHFMEYDYNVRGLENDAYMLLGGHVGGGLEIKFSRLLISADMRYVVVQAPKNVLGNPDGGQAEQALCADGSCGGSTSLGLIENDETTQDGVQFNLGLGLRW